MFHARIVETLLGQTWQIGKTVVLAHRRVSHLSSRGFVEPSRRGVPGFYLSQKRPAEGVGRSLVGWILSDYRSRRNTRRGTMRTFYRLLRGSEVSPLQSPAPRRLSAWLR